MKSPVDHLKWCVHQDHVQESGLHSIDEIIQIYCVVSLKILWPENVQIKVVE